LRRKATWEYPVAGNVLTGESSEAVAIVCESCLDQKLLNRERSVVDAAPILEAVEFSGSEAIYHPVGELEEIQ